MKSWKPSKIYPTSAQYLDIAQAAVVGDGRRHHELGKRQHKSCSLWWSKEVVAVGDRLGASPENAALTNQSRVATAQTMGLLITCIFQIQMAT